LSALQTSAAAADTEAAATQSHEQTQQKGVQIGFKIITIRISNISQLSSKFGDDSQLYESITFALKM
jgi:hypothetical protein